MSWRLYSWRRFTWTSKMASGFSSMPRFFFVQLASWPLLLRLIFAIAERKFESSANFSSFLRSSRWVIQLSPIDSEMSCESEGFALRSQRRGVMPLVTLWNFSGQSS